MEGYRQVLSYMDENKVRTAIVAGTGLLVSLYVIKKFTGKKYKLPPGPKPWPIVGNILGFVGAPDSRDIFKRYHETYGDIFTVHLGPSPFVVLGSYDLIREAFITKGNDFAGRFSPYTLKLVSRGGKSIVAGQFNPVWQTQRKILHGALRQYASGKHLEIRMHESFSIISDYIHNNIENGPLDVIDTMTLLVYNIICSITYGKVYEKDDEEFNMVLNSVDSLNMAVSNGLLPDFFPFLSFLPSPTENKIKKELELIQDFLNQKWDEHNATYDPNCVSDVMYHIIKMREELKESKEENSVLSQLTEDHYLEIISDMFLAGTDTSRYTLSWVILYIAAHPQIQLKMQEEIDRAIGSRDIKIQDRQILPYTEAVLHEVMRLRPIGPMLFPHTTTCETSVGGYTLPPNTIVMANIMSLHMDPVSYPDPEKFQPERFLDENGKFIVRPGEWMPFSAGRRVCVGESVAKVELHLLTAMLFQKFSFFPVDGKPIDFDCQGIDLAMFPKIQNVTVKPRA